MRENRVYVDGNTVRRERQVEERPVREVRRSAGAAAGRRRKVRRWNVAFFGFMIAAVGMIALCLSWYILVNASITASIKNIATLESELNTLRRTNDEAYAMANSSVNLEEIKRIAIEELGMQYAKEGQIVIYSDAGNDDYVHQMAEIPAENTK